MLQPQQFFGRHLPMVQEDIYAATRLLGLKKPSVIAAVIQVEAGGDPYLSDGRPKTLFEAHKFGAYTKYIYNKHTDTKGKALSARSWNRTLYGPAGAWQYKRIELAANLNNAAALRASSWGGFQIMGDNFKMCGYANVDDFVLAMADSASAQLMAFCKFIQAAGLADELRREEWAAFARQYNGPLYAENKYDTKLKKAEAQLVSTWATRYAKAQNVDVDINASDLADGSPDYALTRSEIIGLQATINATKLLIKPIKADGWYGPATAAAIKAVQRDHKLEESGLFDKDTLAALHYEPPATLAA